MSFIKLKKFIWMNINLVWTLGHRKLYKRAYILKYFFKYILVLFAPYFKILRIQVILIYCLWIKHLVNIFTFKLAHLKLFQFKQLKLKIENVFFVNLRLVITVLKLLKWIFINRSYDFMLWQYSKTFICNFGVSDLYKDWIFFNESTIFIKKLPKHFLFDIHIFTWIHIIIFIQYKEIFFGWFSIYFQKLKQFFLRTYPKGINDKFLRYVIWYLIFIQPPANRQLHFILVYNYVKYIVQLFIILDSKLFI